MNNKKKLTKKEYKHLLRNRKWSPMLYAEAEYNKDKNVLYFRYYPTLPHKLLSIIAFIPMILWEGLKNGGEVLEWMMNTWNNVEAMADSCHLGDDGRISESRDRMIEFVDKEMR